MAIERVFAQHNVQTVMGTAQAAAHVGSAICKTPPVMMCNPDEPVGNQNEMLDFSAPRGTGLRLVTGSASAPGNFGWLEAGLGNGTQALAGELVRTHGVLSILGYHQGTRTVDLQAWNWKALDVVNGHVRGKTVITVGG